MSMNNLRKRSIDAQIIRIKDLDIRIGHRCILKDVNCTFGPGRIHGIVGENGCGKSTLFKAIVGLIKPTQGTILIGNKDYHALGQFPHSIGFVIEAPGFLPDMSAYDNLRLLSSIRSSLNKEKLYERIRAVGLDPDDKKPVGKFSMGMKQRLGIAQALLDNPEIVILDEPFNGIDQKGVDDFAALVRKLKSENRTILLSSHIERDINELCDEVYRVRDRRVEMSDAFSGENRY